MQTRFRGLVAAPFTPFHPDTSLNLDVVPAYADLLARNGISAVFVCGTTGECLSLTQAERMRVAEAWRKAAGDRLKVIVHVGHNCLADARELARHAASIGAAAIGAFAPGFFKPRDVDDLADWCAAIANDTPAIPFYYYNIPSMTGVGLKVAPLLERASRRIPSFAGVKFTFEDLADYEACLKFDGGRYDVLFGRDELLMQGWALGARGAVGSTYSYAAPLYLRLIAHLEASRPAEAEELQRTANEMISICNGVGVTHQAATKSMMAWHGVDCGPMRLPVHTIAAAQSVTLWRRLDQLGYPRFACQPLTPPAVA